MLDASEEQASGKFYSTKDSSLIKFPVQTLTHSYHCCFAEMCIYAARCVHEHFCLDNVRATSALLTSAWSQLAPRRYLQRHTRVWFVACSAAPLHFVAFSCRLAHIDCWYMYGSSASPFCTMQLQPKAFLIELLLRCPLVLNEVASSK